MSPTPSPAGDLRSGRAPGTGWAGSGDPRRTTTADVGVRRPAPNSDRPGPRNGVGGVRRPAPNDDGRRRGQETRAEQWVRRPTPISDNRGGVRRPARNGWHHRQRKKDPVSQLNDKTRKIQVLDLPGPSSTGVGGVFRRAVSGHATPSSQQTDPRQGTANQSHDDER